MIHAYREGMYVLIDKPSGLGETSWKLSLGDAARLYEDLRQIFTDTPVYSETLSDE